MSAESDTSPATVGGAVVVVTGAGSGIGRASALAFAAAGADVVVVADIDEQGGTETVDAVEAQGNRATFVRVDVASPESVGKLFSEVVDRFGRLDIVHNNAGLTAGEPTWPNIPAEKIARVVAVNVAGTLMGTQFAVAAMSSQGKGVIINTSSAVATLPLGDDPVYAATKAAVSHFTQSCAALATSHGIRVNAVAPGFVDTPMIAKTGDGSTPAAWLQAALPWIIPLDPDEVAKAVVELAVSGTAGEVVVMENQFRSA